MNFEESSATNKVHSSVFGIFRRPLTEGRKSACLFVTSPMTGYQDKKHSLIGSGKFQRANLARTGF